MDVLILAAGMGSRYGGLKQVDPVGPGGETVLDYAVYDARRAGFRRAVFVIRQEFEALFRERVGAKYAGATGIEVAYVFQEKGDLPAVVEGADGRLKPWGTGHAVWCARNEVHSPFAVINADDFYGAESFRRLGEFLGAPRAGRYAMVGFRLDQTLSEHGAVSRGVAKVRADRRLESIEERTGILASSVGDGPDCVYSGREIVSMNCWGFTPDVFGLLESGLKRFLAARGADPKTEFYLPAAVAEMIARGEAEVEVLPTTAQWFGITYQGDRPAVVAAIEQRVASGQYPRHLFS